MEASLERTSSDIRMMEDEGHESEDRTWVIARGSEGSVRVNVGRVVRYAMRRWE